MHVFHLCVAHWFAIQRVGQLAALACEQYSCNNVKASLLSGSDFLDLHSTQPVIALFEVYFNFSKTNSKGAGERNWDQLTAEHKQNHDRYQGQRQLS